MADPRDYIVNAGAQLQEGLGQYRAQQEREAALNRPLPEWAVQQMVGPDPSPSLAAKVQAAAPNYQPGLGGAPWANSAPDQWSPPDAASMGKEPQGLGQSHPDVEAAAHAYASGKMSFDQAMAQARKYTMRDMPGLEFGLKVKESNAANVRADANMKREEEISRRVLAATEGRGSTAIRVQELKNEGGENVANIRDRGMDREGQRRAATAALGFQKDLEVARIRANALMKAAEARIAATNDPELKMLQARLANALGDYKTATQAINGTAYIINESKRAELDQDHDTAQREFQQAEKELRSYIAAKGTAGAQPIPQQGGYTPGPAPMPQGAAGPDPLRARPLRTEIEVQEPNMGAVPPGPPPVTGSGRPVQAIPYGGGPAAGAQGATLPPSPVLGPNGKPIVKRLKSGQLVMKMSNGQAAPYNPEQWK